MSGSGEGQGDRREFFRFAARELLRPLADYLDNEPAQVSILRPLRPPGAIDETRFVDACQRCGKCVEVCPVQAIRPLTSPNRTLQGTPYIDPDIAACVLCDELKCTHACPSGALLPLALAALVEMGLAEVRKETCVRSFGEDCSICVDRCPLGATAIRFEGAGPPVVLNPGCVGCGVCQLYCPTTPKAIVVMPT